MRLSAAGLFLVLVVLTCSACRTIRTCDVGEIGVEDAMRLYMTNPTVAEWLSKTRATPVFLGQDTWKIILPDGEVFYTEIRAPDRIRTFPCLFLSKTIFDVCCNTVRRILRQFPSSLHTPSGDP